MFARTADKPVHRVHAVEQRQRERLEFQGDLQAQVGRVLAQVAAGGDGRLPLLGRRDHFLVPNVLAQHQEQVFRLEFVTHVEVFLAAIHMEPLHGRVKVDQPDGDARDADDGQAGAGTLVADEPPLAGVDVERVGEDVDRIETDFLGGTDAVGGPLPGLHPGGVDQAEFHVSVSEGGWCRGNIVAGDARGGKENSLARHSL